MTRSGCFCAAILAIALKGHCASSLQFWKASVPFMRQPESPNRTIRRIAAGSPGKVRPSTRTLRTPAGIAASQLRTGKTAGLGSAVSLPLRAATMPGSVRVVIIVWPSLHDMTGQRDAVVMARACQPPWASACTQACWTPASAAIGAWEQAASKQEAAADMSNPMRREAWEMSLSKKCIDLMCRSSSIGWEGCGCRALRV